MVIESNADVRYIHVDGNDDGGNVFVQYVADGDRWTELETGGLCSVAASISISWTKIRSSATQKIVAELLWGGNIATIV